ncbi:DUF108 domain-containing protein [Paeniglutamicibacter sulfureus]|uniref:aspartate dehydrogenase domain-containing protein n=1 Tax=Paeniglutamicibacter sulfureus TaxID=43666 RepID=UPI0026670DD4|nr:aspartate dehydrogenase domain-containing protein [Paeniglutamicibacter sulfureus]MDO2934636.1 DUF108 domain-containing protein [Paeniglutamicibacter sulfureus]
MKAQTASRIGVIGHGAVGSRVAADLAAGRVNGAVLAGIVVRGVLVDAPAPQLDLAQALEQCDLIVECAGQEALLAHGKAILCAGVDLLITSMGALADSRFLQSLEAAGPGRLFLTSGAIGGLDLLASGARSDGYDSVVVTTKKLPSSLLQPWMVQAQIDELTAATEPVEIFSGSARDAARLFPKSLNVAAAVAMAIGDWEVVSVRLIGDPTAELTEHVIEANGPSGEYCFVIRNKPSPENPRTSGVVPFSVLRSLESIVGVRGGLI